MMDVMEEQYDGDGVGCDGERNEGGNDAREAAQHEVDEEVEVGMHDEDEGVEKIPPLGKRGSRWVQEQLRAAGLSVRKDALALLLGLSGGKDAVSTVLNALSQQASRQMSSTIIRGKDVEAVLVSTTRREKMIAHSGTIGSTMGRAGKFRIVPGGGREGEDGLQYRNGSRDTPFQVIDAFSVPRIEWDFLRKSFFVNESPSSVFGRPESKVHMYRNRYHLLLQRILRNRLFKRPALEMCSSRDYCELTPLQALIGLIDVTKYVLGALNQLEDGRYFLEDTSTSIPVDLSRTQTATGMFTEGCVVVAEGALRNDGVFEIFALGFPPVEKKWESLRASPGIDFFGGGVLNAEDMDEFTVRESHSDVGLLVVLSEVHLDCSVTLDSLRRLFGGFEETGTVPEMYVLMGNFTSVGGNSFGISRTVRELKKGFKSLSNLIAEFPLTRSSSQFVIVPGPGDISPSQALPRPGFVEYFVGDLRATVPDIIMASSPCRIRFQSQCMVLHRDNLMQKMRKSVVVPCEGDSASHFQQLTATILQQSHLCPLPNNVQSTYWEYDHSLFVYPMPDLVRILLIQSFVLFCLFSLFLQLWKHSDELDISVCYFLAFSSF